MGSNWDLVLRFGGTLIVLVLVLLLAWLLLRWMNRRMPGMGASGRSIKVLDRVATGKNSTVMLLRVKDKVLLVAFSEHAVQKLCEFDDPNGEMDPPKAPEYPSFSNSLKDAVKKLGRPKNGGDEP